MKKIHFILLFFLPLLSFGQISDKWEGHYSGELTSNSKGGTNSYHMEIIFKQLNDSTYNWTIVYGQDSLRQERKYLLRKIDTYQYTVDEQNGIVLSTNLIQNTFISVFEVQGNLIHATYTFKKNKIYFKLTSSSARTETGDIKPSEDNDESIPLVYSYASVAYQSAILKRIKSK
ncbi:MAG: hypothetical protein GQ574_02915 [Crocinitomix sp.]|nr:hypothetical protein [Crocinitomix sp.]